MYVGVPNPITVVAEGISCKNTNVAIEDGAIVPGESLCKFVVSFYKPGVVRGRVFLITKTGQKILYETKFRVKKLPNPTAKIGGIRNDTIRKSSLVAQLGVLASLEGFDFDAKFSVTNYTLIINRDMKTIFGKTISKTAKFDDEVISQLQSLKDSDMVFVYDIMARAPDGSDRKLDPIYLKVID